MVSVHTIPESFYADTHKNGDFGAIYVTAERRCAAPSRWVVSVHTIPESFYADTHKNDDFGAISVTAERRCAASSRSLK